MAAPVTTAPGASGYALACGGEEFGKAFASKFLRDGAIIKASPENHATFVRHAYLHYDDWGFKYYADGDYESKPTKRYEYSNFSQFLKSDKWETHNGGL